MAQGCRLSPIRHFLRGPRQPITLLVKAPDFALQHIFSWKIIRKNDFIVKFIDMYSLIFTLIVWSIFLNLLLFLENVVYFFKKGNQIFRLHFDRNYRNNFLYFI